MTHPVMPEFLGVSISHLAAGVCGLLLGLTGLSLCEGAIRLAERWRDDPKMPPFGD